MRIFSKILIAVSVIVFFLSSCGRTIVPGRNTIPFVENLLTDSLSVRYSHLLSYAPIGSHGTITIIGDAKRCLDLSELFLSIDAFDNITGDKVPDGLPDFAGETISTIIDYANAPYQGYLDNDNFEFLSELNVRNAISALNTKCALGPNDKQLSMSKNPAKMIIFASSYAEEYGLFDTDTLFRSFGIDVPLLVSGAKEDDLIVIEECFSLMRKRNVFTHGVFYPKAECCITYPIAGLADEAYEEASGNFNDSYRYSRAGNMDKETFVLVRFSERYLSQEIVDYMSSATPETYKHYVQN